MLHGSPFPSPFQVWFLVEAANEGSVAPLALMQQQSMQQPTDSADELGSASRAARRGAGVTGGEGGAEADTKVGADTGGGLAGGGWLCDTMWSGVLHQLGGGYAELARFPALDASTALGARLLRPPSS